MESLLRCFAIALLGLCVACFGSQTEAASLDDVNDPGAPAECFVATDCVPAGPSCCDAWTHAVPRSSGWEQACEDVGSQCQDQVQQPATTASCQSGSCVLVCLPVVCDQTFGNGYATDSFGCLRCEGAGTAPPSNAECQADADCVRVAADCCGCANGGADTAVSVSEADTFSAGLGCETSPACPGVDVCQAEVAPRCLNNACVLLPQTDSDFNADAGAGLSEVTYCGSADLPACPDGQVCVLNAPGADDANMNGLGICQDS